MHTSLAVAPFLLSLLATNTFACPVQRRTSGKCTSLPILYHKSQPNEISKGLTNPGLDNLREEARTAISAAMDLLRGNNAPATEVLERLSTAGDVENENQGGTVGNVTVTADGTSNVNRGNQVDQGNGGNGGDGGDGGANGRQGVDGEDGEDGEDGV
ncbi:MAG: hypothetical protein Q9183_005495, partial [Haloplaca sp. 2 TL-2023]